MRPTVLAGVLIFVGTIILIELLYLAIRLMRSRDEGRVRRRLKKITAAAYKPREVDIVRKNVLSEIPWLNRVLKSFARIREINFLAEQANAPYPVSVYLLLAGLLGAMALIFGNMSRLGWLMTMLMTIVAGFLPFFYLLVKKQKRLENFQKQLPDALELVARAMRAGHSFNGGMKMVADEFSDPIGPEFERTLEEINFGLSVIEAMRKFVNRVESPDLRFFVVAVIVQRETGGNLAEIIEKIGTLIRDRYVLQGKIRTLSAEGRFSALVLIVLPFLIGGYFVLTQPEYVKVLVTDPMGRNMLAGAGFLMLMGMIVMNRMVKIKV